MESIPEFRDELDMAQVLFASKDALAAAWPAGLPLGMFTRAEADKIEALRSMGSVLDEDLRLLPKFRSVLEATLAGRAVAEITGDDCRAIGAQAHVWHELPFRDDWNLVVYRNRG